MGPICLSKPSIPWLGIVWNSDKRGKNDGSLTDENGVHVYFQLRLLRTAVQGAEVQNNCAGDSNQVGEREYVDE